MNRRYLWGKSKNEQKVSCTGAWMGVCAFWMCLLILGPCRAETLPLPKVLLITAGEDDDANAELFRAVRAQLSASPLVLQQYRGRRLSLQDSTAHIVASRIADETGASMLLWVEDGLVCKTLYYLPGSDGGRFVVRILNLESGTQSGRIEYISVAVASMVEKFLETHQLQPPKPREKKTYVTPSGATTNLPKWSRLQIKGGYSGVLFAKSDLSHGGYVGIQWVPWQHWVVGASFSSYGKSVHEDNELRLTLHSRLVSASLAYRMAYGKLDVRGGVAYTLDIRTFSAESTSGVYQSPQSGSGHVSSVSPFVTFSWLFSQYIGMFADIGCYIALNETTYESTFDSVNSVRLGPYTAKPFYIFGVMIIF